jgi:2-dehydro-3-deoxygalactonokinase
MGQASFVAGDWGTSHLRVFLCSGEGLALDSAQGPGAADAGGRFASVFDGLVAPWQQRHGPLPAVLCGMVGSSIGWLPAPYVPCPAIPEQIALACVSLREGSIHIVPGLSCRNRLNAPDYMRGEETQILGALSLEPTLRRGHHLLCLPGTHTKWVMLADGAVHEFLTAPTGEVFALLRDHSVLLRDASAVEDVVGDAAFEAGLAHFNQFPQAQLLHQLFECRARRLSGELSAQAAAAYLSGLLIASDVGGALRLLSAVIEVRTVHLIGSSQLTRLYAMGLAAHDYAVRSIEGTAASLAGLAQAQRQLSARCVTHAAS